MKREDEAIELFTTALSAVKSPPCVRYQCGNKPDCAAHELACSSFVAYVRSGRVYAPTAIVPLNMRHSSQIEHTRYPVATKELFAEAMAI